LITNYGSPTHIHLSVSEELKGLITFLRDNPYVLQKEYVSAVARIPQEGKTLIQGQIFITAGYGSRKRGFPVQLGKTDTKPQEHPRDEVYAVDEEEELNSQKPVTRISGSRSANGSGRFSSFIRKSF